MANKYFRYKNENPLGKETSDCVIRAIAGATGKSWDTVYMELYHLGFQLKAEPSDKEVMETYLENNGFKRHKLSVKKGQRRPTVLSFTKVNPNGIYILRIANHIVVVRNGVYYDIWDCGEYSVYTYWERM